MIDDDCVFFEFNLLEKRLAAMYPKPQILYWGTKTLIPMQFWKLEEHLPAHRSRSLDALDASCRACRHHTRVGSLDSFDDSMSCILKWSVWDLTHELSTSVSQGRPFTSSHWSITRIRTRMQLPQRSLFSSRRHRRYVRHAGIRARGGSWSSIVVDVCIPCPPSHSCWQGRSIYMYVSITLYKPCNIYTLFSYTYIT